ncbi:dTDP-glucose 4,6-dehydratase [Longispora fulva]|uniref:Nucleoside-diphosphate-sugar epimerase n=1 Tax=Longispora fulva TaxID=619741 RepID=A0A8J7GQN6_9ACTN|nr:NAD-dependent epimerase/dehydratase family protein [Longispora fulva]MBG6137159.1 nucleoside-diphosphate-sugar epimerase [Longispora fulva]GIG61487.1 dTDP-glucose 4,6-dehydratase [Longispora fulva]
MNIFLAGATGTLGRPLIRQLLDDGHRVLGLTRDAAGAERLAALRVTPVIADALDRDGLLRAVDGLSADVVLHELTALKKAPLRHRDMALTDRLRVEGTANLLAAARVLGARRFLTQSIIFGYGFGAVGPVTEDTPLATDDGSPFWPHLAAIRSTEEQVFAADGIEGVALRYGLFYGGDDALAPMLRKRQLPVPRSGNMAGWVHIEDAASGTVAAVDKGRAGEAYNLVDDEPATWADVFTTAAKTFGAPAPLRLPGWVLRLAAPYGGAVMTRSDLRVSNAKAKRELGWEPTYRTYREGFGSS